jgi:hypothetical protein
MDSESFEIAIFKDGMPVIMPGEDVEKTSKPFGAYDPHGKLISEDALIGAELFANYEKRRAHHFMTGLIHQITTFHVSTVYLGMNHNNHGGPPLVWETMATSSGNSRSHEWLDFQMRYCTRAAALNGHLKIVAVLLSGGMQLTSSNVEIPGHQCPEEVEAP